MPTARALGEQLYRLAQREAEPTPLLEAHEVLGDTLFYPGRLCHRPDPPRAGESRSSTRRRSGPWRSTMTRRLGCGVFPWRRNTLWCLGYPAQALRRSQEALALAQALAHPQSLALAQHYAAFLHHRRRETPAVQAQAEALLTLATAQGFPLYVGLGTCWRGWALATQGQGEAGLAQMHQGLAAVLATGQELARPLVWSCSPRRRGTPARSTRGCACWPRPWRRWRQVGGATCSRRRIGSRASCCCARPSPDAAQAEACFQQALAVARRQQAKSWELRAAMSLSRLWQQQGKRAEAHELLAPIYGWFTEGFDTADLQEAKALLAELEGEHG